MKHNQVRNSIIQEIETGTLAASERLPGEKDLAIQYGVSVGTVVRALDGMTREGWLVRRRGSGTYVRTRDILPPSGITFVVPFDLYRYSHHIINQKVSFWLLFY